MSGTGTRAFIPHQVTAAQLLAAARLALAGGEYFSEEALLSYLNDAVREYSQHLPRVGTTQLVTVAGARHYALPWDTGEVLAARFAAGGAALPRMSHKRPSFGRWPAYDFLPRLDLTSPPQLLLSYDPVGGETIEVTVQRPHAHELAAGDALTVPAEHHHVLLQYVLFAAARQLAAAEEAAPTGGSLLMGQLAANARRRELAYLQALNRVLTQRQGQSATVVWG